MPLPELKKAKSSPWILLLNILPSIFGATIMGVLALVLSGKGYLDGSFLLRLYGLTFVFAGLAILSATASVVLALAKRKKLNKLQRVNVVWALVGAGWFALQMLAWANTTL